MPDQRDKVRPSLPMRLMLLTINLLARPVPFKAWIAQKAARDIPAYIKVLPLSRLQSSWPQQTPTHNTLQGIGQLLLHTLHTFWAPVHIRQAPNQLSQPMA